MVSVSTAPSISPAPSLLPTASMGARASLPARPSMTSAPSAAAGPSMAALASTLVGPSAPTKLTIVGARRAVVLAPLAAGPSLVQALKSATSVPPRSSSTSPLQSTPSHSGASTLRPSKTHRTSVDFAAGRPSASSIDAARPRAPPAATGAQSSHLTRVASSVCASGLPATPRDVQLWLTTLSRTPTLSVRAGRSEFGVSPTSVASSAAGTHQSVSIAAHVGGDSVNQLGRTKGSSSTRPPLPPSLKPPTLPAPPQHFGVRSGVKAQGERTRTAPKRVAAARAAAGNQGKERTRSRLSSRGRSKDSTPVLGAGATVSEAQRGEEDAGQNLSSNRSRAGTAAQGARARSPSAGAKPSAQGAELSPASGPPRKRSRRVQAREQLEALSRRCRPQFSRSRCDGEK